VFLCLCVCVFVCLCVCRDILVTLGLKTNTLSIGALLGAFFMLGSTRKSTIN
jgi:hypothetical protein